MVDVFSVKLRHIALLVLLAGGMGTLGAQDSGSASSVEVANPVDETAPAIDAQKPEDWKILSPTGISLGLRAGSVLWSGLSMPVSTAGTPANINGINGKNFLYPVFPIIGIGSRFSFGTTIRLSPSLDFVLDEYVYRADLDRAFRTPRETGYMVGPVATVIGFLVSVPVWFDIPLMDHWLILSLSPGMAFYPRIAVAALDNSTGIDKITESLNKDAKWLYPQTGIGVRFSPGKWFAASAEIQLMYPIYHLWGSDGLPFEDGLMLTGTFCFDFYF